MLILQRIVFTDNQSQTDLCILTYRVGVPEPQTPQASMDISLHSKIGQMTQFMPLPTLWSKVIKTRCQTPVAIGDTFFFFLSFFTRGRNPKSSIISAEFLGSSAIGGAASPFSSGTPSRFVFRGSRAPFLEPPLVSRPLEPFTETKTESTKCQKVI